MLKAVKIPTIREHLKLKGGYSMPNVGIKARGVSLLKDTDKDGVVDALDCNPRNKNEQGFLHDVKEKVKEKYEDYKKTSRVKGEAALVQRRKEVIKTAAYEEEMRGEKRRRDIKARYAPIKKKAVSSGVKQDFMSSILYGSPSSQALMGTKPPVQIKKKSKRRKQKPKKRRKQSKKQTARHKGKRKVVIYV